jgi:hypothetical protein
MVKALVPLTAALVVLKIAVAAVIPVFGDEAYYLLWGLHPAGGYYDLPPMIGWWLAPLVKISLNPLWLRTLNLLAGLLPAFTLYEWLQPKVGRDRAVGAAALFFFLPLPFLSVISFPDVPLMLFSFFSAFLYQRAQENREGRWPLEGFFSGIFWGCAFLSKYFAIFLLPVFILLFLLDRGRRWRNAIAFVLGALPFVAQHVLWNRDHCWSNFVFNLVTRQRVNEGTVGETLGAFIAYSAIVSAPLSLSILFRPFERSQSGPDREGARELERFFLLLGGFPLLVFLATAALGRGQGLHWLLFLTPFWCAWAALRFPLARLRLAMRFSAGFSLILGGAVLVAFLFPGKVLEPIFLKRYGFEYRLLTKTREFVAELKGPLSGVEAVFTGGYTLSSELEYLFRREGLPASFHVLGEGSRFGRTFDWITDYSKLEGKRVAIVTPGFFFRENWERFFARLEVHIKSFEGVDYMFVVGEGFRATEYREEVALPANRRFYPPFLPGRCALTEGSPAL